MGVSAISSLSSSYLKLDVLLILVASFRTDVAPYGSSLFTYRSPHSAPPSSVPSCRRHLAPFLPSSRKGNVTFRDWTSLERRITELVLRFKRVLVHRVSLCFDRRDHRLHRFGTYSLTSDGTIPPLPLATKEERHLLAQVILRSRCRFV
ncbi:hypothetical protein PsorP6_003931 [Peronosclerospora sorghi]|uniref:Uncharacterized protein n=1 Tax=Peronosclerospora sorghi TaxID=230839 RepID=A0ACC0VNQ3_9STRA|nr:hypothetical protein PsorP6_003931 [Peronosclerospora sorghi]